MNIEYEEKYGKGDEFSEDGKCQHCDNELGEYEEYNECDDCHNKRVWCEENYIGMEILLKQGKVEYTPAELEVLTKQLYEDTLSRVLNFKKSKLEKLIHNAEHIYNRIGV